MGAVVNDHLEDCRLGSTLQCCFLSQVNILVLGGILDLISSVLFSSKASINEKRSIQISKVRGLEEGPFIKNQLVELESSLFMQNQNWTSISKKGHTFLHPVQGRLFTLVCWLYHGAQICMGCICDFVVVGVSGIPPHQSCVCFAEFLSRGRKHAQGNSGVQGKASFASSEGILGA